jgi:hypothetical protein
MKQKKLRFLNLGYKKVMTQNINLFDSLVLVIASRYKEKSCSFFFF